MQLTYDSKHNVAYFCFKEKSGTVDTIHISDSLNVDMAPDGSVYGIELLNANEQIAGRDNNSLIVINESLGRRQEIKLSA